MPGADGIFISPILSTALFLQQLPHFPSVAFSSNQLHSVCAHQVTVLPSHSKAGFFLIHLLAAPWHRDEVKERHNSTITQPHFHAKAAHKGK